MTRKKLFLTAVTLLLAVFGGGGKISAYTIDQLVSAGWTKVTASSITGTNDNYYILVDANSSNYVMSNDASHYRPCYKTIDDPIANPSFVWILEGNDNNFALKSYSTGAYFTQADGWNTSMTGSTGSTTFIFTLNDGKYSLNSNGRSDYVGHWNDSGAAVASDGENIAANKAIGNAPGFYLYSISKSAYNAALTSARFASISTATKASPADVTAYIQNADWSGDWGGWSRSGSWGNQQWGKKTLESWNATNVIVKQELRGIPNGSYKLVADIISGPEAAKTTYVYAVGDAQKKSDIVSVEASAGNYDTMSNEVAGKTLTADNVSITDNTITIGFNQPSGWIVADNFKLYYYGPNLAASAILPDGDMTAGTWYYFDITIDGTYNLTSNTLSDIVYTTDGSILVEDASSITTTFSSSSVALSSGRYYVKSTSAQTFRVAPASYSYNVGAATSSITEGSYIQSLATVSFTFTEATSNDPSASFSIINSSAVATLKKSGSNVKTGELSLEGSTLTATFSDVTLDMASSYSIEIPAGVVGYEGKEQNALIAVSFNTPAIKDGVYYMLNNATKKYISRSGNYATQAILDEFGLAFKVSTDNANNTELQYFDSYLWLGDDGDCYGDCSGDRIRHFNVTAVTGGYKFLNTKNNKYLAGNTNKTIANAEDDDNAIWTVETTATHANNYTKNADSQAAAAATAAGMTGITTKDALETELKNNYGETNIAITGSKAEKFQQYAGDSYELAENTYYHETVNDLVPGLYKLSVNAFQRAASNDRVAAADGARSLIYLYAGTAKTQLKSIMDYGANVAYTSDFTYNGKHYPDNEASAYTALETGKYNNEVYFYVPNNGNLEIGIKMPSRLGGNFSTWAIYNNWTLTRYEAKATTAEKTALADAITAAEGYTLGFENGEYAPYKNIDACKALAAAKAINPEIASGAEVVSATSALTSATWTANDGEVNAFGDPLFAKSSNDGAQLGWITDHSEGLGGAYHARAFVLTSGENYNNLVVFNQGDGTRSAGYFRFDGTSSTKETVYTYGATTGYTLPLKQHTYKLTAKVGGWGQVDKDIKLSLVDFEGTTIEFQTKKTPSTGVNTGGSVVDFELYVDIPAAGNYKVQLTNGNTTVDQAVVLSNLELLTCDKATMSISDAQWATFVAPFDVTIPDGVTAYNITGVSGTTLNKEEVTTTIPANKPVLLKSETVVNKTFYGKAIAGTPTNGLLTGVYEDTPAVVGEYVLQKQGEGVNFYLVEAGQEPTVKANRAYLTAPASAKMLFFDDDEATAIESVDVQTAGEYDAIYTATGVKVNSLQKGLNIVVKNGKSYKIFVK